MSKIDDLIKTLALIYETKAEADRAYEVAHSDFILQNAELINRRKKLEQQIDEFRNDILEESLQIEELPPQIQVQWRDTPTIFEFQAMYDWALENREFLKLDEKSVKEYVKENGSIADADGVVLAGTQKKPILIAGEKTLISWLDELRFNQNHSEE